MASLLSDELPDELLPYKGRLSPRFYEVRKDVIKFILEAILPSRKPYADALAMLGASGKYDHPTKVPQPELLDKLRNEAKKRKLWNFFLPEVCGLSVLEYSPIAELLGAFPLANLAMNCAAPDTGNMEVLEKYGTAEQKEKFLEPLLNGSCRSCFAMTEPGVASSDATNICTKIDFDADRNEYVINGHKWFISGAMRPECKFALLLGKTRFDGPLHTQQSMLIVPMDEVGVKILRPLAVFGHEHDHAEIIFDDVRVPKENIILGEGRGFEIAQGRLGPGRIHHCMRTLGTTEMALESMVYRAQTRVAFGSVLSEKDSLKETVAKARVELTKLRQLVYLAAVVADEKGFKEARKYIAMIKYAVPRECVKIVDDAIQIHGAHGVSQDSRLAGIYTGLRTLRVADGPDIVHLNTIAKLELGRQVSQFGKSISGINPNIEKYHKFDHVKEIAYPRGSYTKKSKL